VRAVRILIAADANWLVDDLVAALGDDQTSFVVCSEGREVARQLVARQAVGEDFDVGIFDLQIGSMGGMAVTMALRLDASAGSVPSIPVVMLLDRVADVHLARRSGAEGWLVKPLDPLRIRRAVRTVIAGGSYTEGLTTGAPESEPSTDLAGAADPAGAPPGDTQPTGSEAVTAG
jgi:DNA-binding NarL/FixJ family response regulator